MAIGFLPKYNEGFPLTDLTQQQFIVIAIEVAKKIYWKVSNISTDGILAYTDRAHEIKIKIENGIATIQSTSIGNEMIDWGRNKKNVSTFINTFDELKKILTNEEIEEKYLALKDQMSVTNESILFESSESGISQFFSIFKPRNGYFVTPILIDFNILIFILMVISGANFLLPDNQSLLIWGANFRPITLNGEWWRLITNCFLHIGIVHLLMNMYALLYIGILLEPILGKAKFIAAYLLTGIAASITSLWWHEITISAGASGAIFGMYGVFLALLTTNLIEKTARKTLFTSIAIFVGYNLVNGFKDGIDNAAHTGGLISGIIIGYAFLLSLRKSGDERFENRMIGLVTALVLAFTIIVYQNTNNDLGIYDRKMEEFASMESKALEVYKLPTDTPDDKFLSSIKDNGIPYWEKNLQLIESFKKLKLPPQIIVQNQRLKEYCELRLKSYNLLYKAISEHTDQYNDQIENYNKEISAKIEQISGGK